MKSTRTYTQGLGLANEVCTQGLGLVDKVYIHIECKFSQ